MIYTQFYMSIQAEEVLMLNRMLYKVSAFELL